MKDLFTETFGSKPAYDIKQYIMAVYKEVKEKADSNKKTYFTRKHSIQKVSLIVSILTIIVGAMAILIFGKWVYILIAVIEVINAILRYLMDYHNSRKNAETWVRHRLHQMDLECEIFSYLYREGEYRYKDDNECLEILKTRFRNVEQTNIKRFKENMKKFEE